MKRDFKDDLATVAHVYDVLVKSRLLEVYVNHIEKTDYGLHFPGFSVSINRYHRKMGVEAVSLKADETSWGYSLLILEGSRLDLARVLIMLLHQVPHRVAPTDRITHLRLEIDGDPIPYEWPSVPVVNESIDDSF